MVKASSLLEVSSGLRALPEQPWFRPDWDLPPGVKVLCSLRNGSQLRGKSQGVYQGLNLGDHVGDAIEAVEANRQLLLEADPQLKAVQWLRQVHGVRVARIDHAPALGAEVPEADAAISCELGLACAVLTADCLPVLFCDADGREVAAAHAGWRGLLSGVLATTLADFSAPPSSIRAWIGPAIGPAHFEVGTEVRDAFLKGFQGLSVSQIESAFRRKSDAGDGSEASPEKYLADLPALARMQLKSLGVRDISCSGLCTYAEPRAFYSYRRDGETGRFASLIYRT